jgi:hypothetical protein
MPKWLRALQKQNAFVLSDWSTRRPSHNLNPCRRRESGDDHPVATTALTTQRKRNSQIAAYILSKAAPFLVLCGTMGALITATIWGWPVSNMLLLLNGAGLVLAIFNWLDPRV